TLPAVRTGCTACAQHSSAALPVLSCRPGTAKESCSAAGHKNGCCLSPPAGPPHGRHSPWRSAGELRVGASSCRLHTLGRRSVRPEGRQGTRTSNCYRVASRCPQTLPFAALMNSGEISTASASESLPGQSCPGGYWATYTG